MNRGRYIFGAIYDLYTKKVKLKKFNIKYEIYSLIDNEKFIILNDTYKRQLIIFKIRDKKIISLRKSDINYILRKVKNSILFL